MPADAAHGTRDGGEVRAADPALRARRSGVSRADDLVLAARRRRASERSVRARRAESGEHVAHQRCLGEPQSHHPRPRAFRTGAAWFCASRRRAKSWCAACFPRCSLSLRGLLAEFTEAEQRQLISQLKRLVRATWRKSHKQDAAGAGAMKGSATAPIAGGVARARLRRTAAETEARAIAGRRAAGWPRGPRRRRLAGARNGGSAIRIPRSIT